TNPDKCIIPLECVTDKNARAIIAAMPEALCFACYSLRWAVETTYLEQKTHWGLSEYMLRSVTGIERLINLQLMVYAVLCILPWIAPEFKSLERTKCAGAAIRDRKGDQPGSIFTQFRVRAEEPRKFRGAYEGFQQRCWEN
ncbi:MAG: hypothetical protein IJU76_10235, partial [Desulfovibrionaceae bacterium]|nr:hypothetical protein [Desulfovibrionaceae bacterium]